MKREKSCGALVYRITQSGQKELLFIKHRHGTQWSFPKGHMEEGESEVQTALREVKEETAWISTWRMTSAKASSTTQSPMLKNRWSISGACQKRPCGPPRRRDWRNALDPP